MLMQRLSGVTDNVMGMVNPGGRKTATEVRSSTSFSVNRLKTQAEFNSALGWSPLSQMMVSNTQQFYPGGMVFRLAGSLQQDNSFTSEVSPEDLLGFYDWVPVDGTLPIDRLAQANMWKEILMGMSQMPQIAAGYNVGKIFEWMAQLGGLKNISQFRLEVMPDQNLQAMAQSGQAVPVPGNPGVPR